jgi:hypothetical protein
MEKVFFDLVRLTIMGKSPNGLRVLSAFSAQRADIAKGSVADRKRGQARQCECLVGACVA